MYSKGPGFFIFFQETEILGGAGSPTVIIYETLPKKTVRKILRKIKKYRKKPLSREIIDKVVLSMVREWPEEDRQEKMSFYDQDRDQANWSYEKTLYQLFDDDLALLLILASI